MNTPARPIHLPFEPPLVAGVSHRQAELRDVVEGDVLTVVAADDNPHDALACEVRTKDGVMLGFIPKDFAPRLRATGGTTWPAYVREVRRGETWGLGIVVGRSEPQESDEPTPAPARARVQPASFDFVPGEGDREIPNENPDEPVMEVRAAPSVPLAPQADIAEDVAVVEPAVVVVADTVVQLVTAPSGRLLGVLLRIEGDKVIVTKDGGTQVTFPFQSVNIRDAA